MQTVLVINGNRGFFLPDGDGGEWSVEKSFDELSAMRDAAIGLSYWPASSFTGRYAWMLDSHHNGSDYRQVVGELTQDRRFVILILESLDEGDNPRFVVLTMKGPIHVDADKVRQVDYFVMPPE